DGGIPRSRGLLGPGGRRVADADGPAPRSARAGCGRRRGRRRVGGAAARTADVAADAGERDGAGHRSVIHITLCERPEQARGASCSGGGRRRDGSRGDTWTGGGPRRELRWGELSRRIATGASVAGPVP